MAQPGAQAAYRGYRLQALYALERLLASTEPEDISFHPESVEDLALYNEKGDLLEAVQVKSYSGLALSDLHPEKPDSFFARVAQLLQSPTPPAILLVNFGSIGPEMRGAWLGDERHREQVTSKLLVDGFDLSVIKRFFERIALVEKDENQTQDTVYSKLQELSTAGDPATALDLLTYWVLVVSEGKESITRQVLISKLSRVAEFLVDLATYQREFGTAIAPILDETDADTERLKAEFYSGVQARYEHILAGLDFRRDHQLARIDAAFETHNIVIIHAASGQGKSTLAHRYIHDAYPNNWRFQVKLIDNRQHALSIAQALMGHARALQLPMLIYVDVSPRDHEWPELARQLAHEDNVRILVTVREEDFRRAEIPRSEFIFAEFDLTFDEQEARLIYERALESRATSSFMDFEEAWERFGGQGPLMEFVYFLTETVKLRDRLQEQVKNLEERVRTGTQDSPYEQLSQSELHLLRMVSIVSACEARLSARNLVDILHLAAPRRTIELFEREYLIRQTEAGQEIEGLHPIRSHILSELLTDPVFNPWIEAAQQVLPAIIEGDLETFLLHAFVEHPGERQALSQVIMELNPKTWAGFAGILRALLWLGVTSYLERNTDCIEAAHTEFGDGWFFVMNLDFAGIAPESTNRWWKDLGNIIPPERQARIDNIRAMQSDPKEALEVANRWLRHQRLLPVAPQSEAEWADFAFAVYWMGHLGVTYQSENLPDDGVLDEAAARLGLQTVADIAVALHCLTSQGYQKWLDRNRTVLETRLAQEYNIVSIERVSDRLTVHFIPFSVTSNEPRTTKNDGGSDELHGETIERITLVCRLFPTFARYGSQGHGYRFGALKSPLDSYTTKEGIPPASLTHGVATYVNSIGHGLGGYQYRPENWDEYVARLLERRQMVVTCLDQLQRGSVRHLTRDQGSDVWTYVVQGSPWLECATLLSTHVPLPKSAVDPWGFAWESMSDKAMLSLAESPARPMALVLHKHQSLYLAQRDYHNSLFNFFTQARDVMLWAYTAGKLRDDDPKKKSAIRALTELGIRTDLSHLSTTNLSAALKELDRYQLEFRRLFGHRCADMIDELEQTERSHLNSVWQLWYFFANQPLIRCANPQTQIPNLIHLAEVRLRDRLNGVLNAFQDGASASVLPDLKTWDTDPALWIRLDVQRPHDLWEARQALLAKLSEFLAPIDYSDIEYYLIDSDWRYTIILPVFCGKLISYEAWRLLTFGTVRGNQPVEENPLLHALQPIPQVHLDRLGIELWQIDDLSLARHFSEHVAVLSLLAAQLADLHGLVDLEMEQSALEVVQTELGRRASRISEALQGAYDAMAAMAEKVGALPQKQLEKRPLLQEVVDVMKKLAILIRPTTADDSTHSLTINDFQEYAGRLEQARLYAEMARLLWISDFLETAQP